MKDAHREKLRQLPRERKLYLLQQNQHIKENRSADSSLRKSIPTSNSSSSLFPPKALRQKAAMKRSETSSRLLFNSNGKAIKQLDTSVSHQSLSSSFNSSSEDVSSIFSVDESTPNSSDSQNANSQKEEPELVIPKMNKKRSALPIPAEATVASSEDDKEAPSDNKRAATYKFARRNLSETINNNRSKVGSMILEFDAIAHKLEDKTADESATWLLLDNNTLPRNYNSSIQQLNTHHHPSVSHLFPQTNNPAKPAQDTSSSSLVANSLAYRSLSRKDGSRLASLVTTPTPEESIKRGRDRNSPYYYVERLRSR